MRGVADLTARAGLALRFAHQERDRSNHPRTNTGHMLIGLLKESRGVAARVLAELGIDLRAVRPAVERRMEAEGDDQEADVSDVIEASGATRVSGLVRMTVSAADTPAVPHSARGSERPPS